ncbi:MAG: hydroxymethylglutaryl-CoA lyase [Pseudomonadota bacterium]
MAKEQVTIVEVGPRDGLQNEKTPVDLANIITLVERLASTGLKNVEAGAFVSPKWVPQMASSEEVLLGIKREDGVSYPVLTPNMKGYERARKAHADTVAIFGAASETFSQKNINASVEESIERFKPVIEAAKADSIRVRGYVSCVLGCPYEGDIPVSNVVRVSKTLYELGCYEISLGDTIGVGVPRLTRELIKTVSEEVPLNAIAGHFHDTYGQAVANVYAGLEAGIRTFDASVSGLGGCPYAKGASGNVATEDVVYMLEGCGFDTGVNLNALVDVSKWISEVLGRRSGSKLALALQPSPLA